MRKQRYGNGREKKRRGFGFCDANDTLEITHNIVFSVPIMQQKTIVNGGVDRTIYFLKQTHSNESVAEKAVYLKWYTECIEN